jgi:predicted PurR-regulated permease PerM
VSEPFWSKTTQERWFYLLLGISAMAVVWVFWTYLYVLLYAGVTVVCCWPAYAVLLRWTRGRAWLSSAMTTILLGLLVFGPLAMVLWLFALEVQEVSQILIEKVQSGELAASFEDFTQSIEIPPWLQDFLPEIPDFRLPKRPAPPVPEGLAETMASVMEPMVRAVGHPWLAPGIEAGVEAALSEWANAQIVDAVEQGELTGDILGHLSTVEEEFTASVQNAAVAALRFAGGELPGIVSAVVNLSIDSLFYIFAILVLFVEGPRILVLFKRLLPVDERYTSDVFQVFGEFSRNMVVGSIATSAIQGVIAGIGFAVAGLEKVIFLSILVFFGSFIPVVGTPVVWVPVVIYMVGTGDYGMAVFLALWCLILVGTIDNILRPLFMRGNSEMHALLIFLAVFGGMYWMGLAGVLVGPIIVAVFMALYRIYVRDFLKIEPAEKSKKPGFTTRVLARFFGAIGERLERSGRAIMGARLSRLADTMLGRLPQGELLQEQGESLQDLPTDRQI